MSALILSKYFFYNTEMQGRCDKIKSSQERSDKFIENGKMYVYIVIDNIVY